MEEGTVKILLTGAKSAGGQIGQRGAERREALSVFLYGKRSGIGVPIFVLLYLHAGEGYFERKASCEKWNLLNIANWKFLFRKPI